MCLLDGLGLGATLSVGTKTIKIENRYGSRELRMGIMQCVECARGEGDMKLHDEAFGRVLRRWIR